jgi:Xaa-Pro aminopeptidase
MSDRPIYPKETPIIASLQSRKQTMMPSELERYRRVGRLASEAMTEVLSAAKPTWTEYQLAGAGAQALWARGLHPALTLVAGERRLPLYRHATATAEEIGRQAMLVFCARGWGLYANLTRFVSFDFLGEKDADLHGQVREIEAAGLNSCRPGVSLNAVYDTLKTAYEETDILKQLRNTIKAELPDIWREKLWRIRLLQIFWQKIWLWLGIRVCREPKLRIRL